jgi:hypothetical protein
MGSGWGIDAIDLAMLQIAADLEQIAGVRPAPAQMSLWASAIRNELRHPKDRVVALQGRGLLLRGPDTQLSQLITDGHAHLLFSPASIRQRVDADLPR